MSNTAPQARPGRPPRVVNDADLNVGRRLRLLRRKRDRSLQELANATNLSVGLISQIERGLSSPSVKHLVALGEELGVGIAWFFDEKLPLDDIEATLIVRRETRRRLSMGEGGVEKQLLSADAMRPLQFFLVTVEPGGNTGDGLYAHSGESVGIVLSGQLLLWVEDRHFLLREDDSFSVPAKAQRRFANPDSQRRAQLLWAVARPSPLDTDEE